MDTTHKNISDDNMMANVANTDSELLKVWNYFKTQSNPVPNYLKNVLNIMGYDNIALISKIDVKEIEEFVRTDLHKFISESGDPCEFYGPVFGKASMSKNEFIIVPGHRRLLEEVIKYCSDIIIDLNANSSEPHCRDRNSKEIATAKMKLSVPAIEFNPTSSARNSPQPQPSSHYFFKEEHAIIKDTPAENQVAVPVDPQHHTEAALPVGQSAAQLYQLPQNLRNSVQPRNQIANQGPPLKCMAPIGPPTKGSLRSNSNIMARQHFQQQQQGYSLTNQAPYVGNQSPIFSHPPQEMCTPYQMMNLQGMPPQNSYMEIQQCFVHKGPVYRANARLKRALPRQQPQLQQPQITLTPIAQGKTHAPQQSVSMAPTTIQRQTHTEAIEKHSKATQTIKLPIDNDELQPTSSSGSHTSQTKPETPNFVKNPITPPPVGKNEDKTDKPELWKDKLVQIGNGEQLKVKLLQNEDNQLSPHNQEGKKVYDRDFLIQLRDHPNSKIKPDNIPDVILAGFDSSKIGDFGRWGIHTPVKYNKFKMP